MRETARYRKECCQPGVMFPRTTLLEAPVAWVQSLDLTYLCEESLNFKRIWQVSDAIMEGLIAKYIQL